MNKRSAAYKVAMKKMPLKGGPKGKGSGKGTPRALTMAELATARSMLKKKGK